MTDKTSETLGRVANDLLRQDRAGEPVVGRMLADPDLTVRFRRALRERTEITIGSAIRHASDYVEARSQEFGWAARLSLQLWTSGSAEAVL